MNKTPALPSHLLFATDLGARSDRAQDRALNLALEWNAKLTVVHALDFLDAPNDQPSRPTAEGARARAFRLLRDQFPNNVEVIVSEGKPADVILRATEERPVDLIITGIAGNEPLAQSIFGSATSALVRRADIPLLVVKKRGLAPYRHVIVASDLSEASGPALKMAMRLFDRSAITLFHVFDMPFSGFVEDKNLYEQKLRPGAIEAAREFAARHLGTEAEGLRIEVTTGDAAVRIADYAAQNDVDLVIAGTLGKSGILGVLLGSVAIALLDEVPCDVMVVPSSGADKDD